ncbi:MAG: calcium/proton exchanger [Euryarchaeota archaeon]|jgi:Ca2+:H+ antiporter|nr:calcium/proton exchanger [Euryarchaeota archaeon]DAC61762.1 MAG TPA: calcium/proton exchanger [Candidatus Poseidoniales archaeon]HII13139.1 calcium/proton exchanger [Candidatus Thalassarchaeaceae archaeon]MBT3847570.1 calcium/proton exchanger [Euryarchaeota archaeon]MBT4156007.1 calcium/proton exchanger [Euryarchaeota archaeon]
MVDAASIVRAFDPRESKLNILLLAVPATVYFNYFQHDENLSFITSMIAIMPLAFLMGKATEEIALRTSESVGGLLNATFGNAAEIIICVLALMTAAENVGTETEEIMINIVQASLIGSILGNLLLVMGLSFVWGGLHHSEQKFSETQVSSNGSLLLLSVIVLIIPTVFNFTVDGTAGDDGVEKLSHAAAVVLLAIYGFFLLFQLKTHSHLFATENAHHEEPNMDQKDAIILLIIATILVSWMAEVLVHSVESAAEEYHLPYLFIGVILLPLFGNAAEHFTAVSVAAKNKMDLSFAISIGSSTQIAVFVAPLMVVIAWILGLPLTFEFGILETIAVFLAVTIANLTAADGKSNWLEGLMLLGTYAILGLAFYFHP